MLLALTLSACVWNSASPVELNGQDSGGQQGIAIGQQLRISLDSNPSTGYRWAIDGAIPA